MRKISNPIYSDIAGMQLKLCTLCMQINGKGHCDECQAKKDSQDLLQRTQNIISIKTVVEHLSDVLVETYGGHKDDYMEKVTEVVRSWKDD